MLCVLSLVQRQRPGWPKGVVVSQKGRNVTGKRRSDQSKGCIKIDDFPERLLLLAVLSYGCHLVQMEERGMCSIIKNLLLVLGMLRSMVW